MKFARMTLQLALRALSRNKMRSALTTIGIVFGVGAVVAMVSIGQGAAITVQQQISSLGSNVLMIYPGATTSGGARSGWGGASTLTEADARAIRVEVPGVEAVAYFDREIVQVVNGNQNWSTVVTGANPEFTVVRDWPVSVGRFYTQREEDTVAKVCVLGQTVVEKVFGLGQDPVGAIIRVKNVPLRVIGVLEERGQTMWGQDQDDVVLVPFSTAERRVLGSAILGIVDQIFVKGKARADLDQVSDDIAVLLRQRHHIAKGQEEDFTVRNTEEIANAFASTGRTMTWLLGSVAAISLLVGGIGIMNILLVSVAERTREIGIRRAVGAKARHILAQFLVESVVLSSAGGVGGVALGVLAAKGVAGLAHWPVVISPLAVGGALVFSGAIGLFFGIYPARQAARLDPISALRYE